MLHKSKELLLHEELLLKHGLLLPLKLILPSLKLCKSGGGLLSLVSLILPHLLKYGK